MSNQRGSTSWPDPARPTRSGRTPGTASSPTSPSGGPGTRSPGPGLGPVPDDPERRTQWEALSRRASATRRWLVEGDRHEPSWPAVRSRMELVDRRKELLAIFETAPADTRPVIDAVRSGQLAFVDVDEILRTAIAERNERRHWILEHWPHVVEYAEVSDAIIAGAWGPDAGLLLGELHEHEIGDALNVAITSHAPWLQAALCAFDADDDTPLTDRQITWLNDVADYRQRHNVTTRDPLGTEPIDPEQHDTFMELLTDLNNARPGRQLDPQELELDVGIEL